MAKPRLDDGRRAILRAFRMVDPKGEYQYNAWSPALVSSLKTEGAPLWWEREFVSLVRHGLLGAEGRGRYRQFWITADGLAALEEGGTGGG